MELSWEINQHDFKSNIYRRIQLAAAVFVIKNTPKDKTHETYASEVQEKLKILWLTKPVQHARGRGLSSALDQHILSQQQYGLSKRLFSIIPKNVHTCLNDFSMQCSSSSDFVQENSNCSVGVQSKVQNCCSKIQINHANFIQAIIQLKSIAEVHSTIPMDLYVNSVSKLVDRSCFQNSAIGMSTNQFASEPLPSSEDSGFHAFQDNSNTNSLVPPECPSSMTGVASSMLLYIVDSGNANQLLTKSIEAILNQLKLLACEAEKRWSVLNLNETINAWTGSLYEQAIQGVHYITEKQSLCPDIKRSGRNHCFSFIQEMIAIFRINTMHKDSFYVRENQMVILDKLCLGTSLWNQAVDLLFHNFHDLVNYTFRKFPNEFALDVKKRNFHYFSTIFNSVETIEESFILLYALKIFLCGASNVLDKLCSENMQHSLWHHGQQVPNTVTELWRKCYTLKNDICKGTVEISDKIRQVKSDIRGWQYVLEESATHIIEKFPLSAVVCSDCTVNLPTF